MPAARRRAGRIKRKLGFEKKIYDNVHGYVDITKNEKLLIDTPIFQRLRRIAQLGLAQYVYPGATHSRFSHCLGAMHAMNRIATSLIDQEILNFDDLEMLRLAALLHDIGHYPFSHVLEVTMRRTAGEEGSHENLGEFILRETSIRDRVLDICDPRKIEALLRGQFRRPLLFQYLVASSLDADKIDYLQRDSVHTGVAYGAFDLERLLSCLTVDNPSRPNWLVVTQKGRQAIEDFLLGRFHMFQSVYYHKAVVAFELMLDRIAEDLISTGRLPNLALIKESTKADERWFASYEDTYVWDVLKKNQDGTSVTNELVRRLLSRTSIKLAQEIVSFSTSEPQPLMEILAKETLPQWLSRRSGVPEAWIFYKEQPRVTFLNPDPDVTVYVEGIDEPKRLVDEEKSIIKKLWDSQFRTSRVYTRNDTSKERIQHALKGVA